MLVFKQVKQFFNNQKKLGLALGGGAARGLAHLGVIKALEHHKIPIHSIAGSSAGCFIGAVYSAGVPIDEMIKRAKRLRWLDFVKVSFSRRSVMSSKKVVSFLHQYIGTMKMNELKIPFVAVATDIMSGDIVTFSASDDLVTDVIQASISFPGVFKPFYYKGKYLVDAGVGANIPVNELQALGANKKIAVNVIPKVTLTKVPNDIKSVMDRSLDLLISRFSNYSAESADLVLHPITENISSFDIKKAGQMIDMGFESVENNLKKIKRLTT